MSLHHAGRHSGPTTPAEPTGAPAPGSRRARRLAEQQAAMSAETAEIAVAPARSRSLKAAGNLLRVGVLGVVVAGTGAFAVAQSGSPADAEISAATAGTLALRSGETASRSEAAGREALEEEGGVTFSVNVDGATQDITTTAATLGEALAEAGVVVGPDDQVSVPLSDAVPVDGTVDIVRVTTETVTEEVREPFATVEKEDPNLPEGERKVETAGVEGVSTATYEVKKAGDAEVSKTLIASVVATAKVDEVVLVGTKKPEPAPAPAPAAAAPAAAAPAVSGDPRSIGRQLAAARGWGADQFSCLDKLWTKESNWRVTADNPTSSAYGIPQALPGSKMASAGADWATNPATQITWGLGYIEDRYGTPCAAWGHSVANNWY